jgi:hypothetical protein
MKLSFAARVQVFAGDDFVFAVHAAKAEQMLRDGQATRRGKSSRVRALNLATTQGDDYGAKGRAGNPQKYTYVEPLGDLHECDCGGSRDCIICRGKGKRMLTDSHCYSLKLQVAHPRNWPIYRAAIVDCLPLKARREIQELFR